MLNKYYKIFLSGLLVLIFSFNSFSNSTKPSGQEPRFNQLKKDIVKVVKNYNGLCVGLAFIRKENPDMIFTMGEDKSVSNHNISENTIFRTASISKMFVALAVLKLQEEGKLSLENPIKDIIPEVVFNNPWEKTHPVRIVHLLEHTTGWDEMHLVEMVHNEARPIALKTALAFHPHSRKSRWAPGSRMSYCNSGYAVMAYIVEKISGMPYEKYVAEAILKPLSMEHTTFFNDSLYKQWSAKTYNWVMKKVDYKNELYRPAGGLNASPKDMATLLKLLLNRGKVDSLMLFKKESINRMELPQSTPAAKAGLALGYGLGNFTSIHNGLTYHGHDGAMDGGLSQLAYLPEHGIGHVILLNANNAQAMQQIIALIRDYEVETLSIAEQHAPTYTGQIAINEGYYLAINPRNQKLFYQDALFAGIAKIAIHDNTVFRSWLIPGAITAYHPISPTQFTHSSTQKIGLVKAVDFNEGEVLYTEDSVLKPISTFRVFGQLALLGLWVFMMITTFSIFFILVILYAINKEKYKASMRISWLPIISSLLIILTFALPFWRIDNIDLLFSKPTFLSIVLMSCSILFLIGAVASGFIIYKSRKLSPYKVIYYPICLLTFLHILASVYLLCFGFIPVITWA